MCADNGLIRCLCRYQGVDWRDKAQWHCNADESPYKESHYDGINVDPLEVLFVKVGLPHRPLLQLCVQSQLSPVVASTAQTRGARC